MAIVKKPSTPSDQADRDAAIFERERDVIVLAGAGCGKTSLLTSRFVERIAPLNDKMAPTEITKLAAVTFTRKAAGELKNRIRGELLSLIESKTTDIRRARAEEALSQLDFAFIGTIHGFADRLLRLRPIEAKISPSYEIVTDTGALIDETLSRWIEGAQANNLRAHWSSLVLSPSDMDCSVASEWARTLLSAGVEVNDYDGEFSSTIGLAGIVRGWVETRDRAAPAEVSYPYNEAKINTLLKKLLNELRKCLNKVAKFELDIGARHLQSLDTNIENAINASTHGEKLNWLAPVFNDAKHGDRKLTKKDCFPESAKHGTWDFYKQLTSDEIKGSPTYYSSIYEPLVNSLFAPATKVRAVILSLFDNVKKRHEVIDQLDLLISLRDLLHTNKEMCDSLAQQFEHIFVDEYQDTDPVQAEIFSSLCKAKGSLTIIGDPKQSIYRFRRADITIFASTIAALVKRGALRAQLKVNFRSRPGLIRSYNNVFPEFFGPSPDPKGAPEFHVETGWVAYSGLEASNKIPESTDSPLCILRLDSDGAEGVGRTRPLEARLAARHIAWLLSPDCNLRVRTQDERGEVGERAIRGKDIAILCSAMTNVGTLTGELRSLGVQVHVTGGNEFASNSLLRRYVLALNAVADMRDGPALMALHQFPFSSVTPLAVATQDKDDLTKPAGALRNWLLEIRQKRNLRPILHTARDVIEKSLALRVLGLGLNSEQDLSILQRFANIFAEKANSSGWDFDETARWARTWLDDRQDVSSPAIESDQAVRILSIHQSKGLEFPVVYLFDGYASAPRDRSSGFRVSNDGKEWSISAGNYQADFNLLERSPNLKESESSHKKEEHKRLHYVAATRAMDYLIIPVPDPLSSTATYSKVWSPLIEGAAKTKSRDVLCFKPTKSEEKSAHTVPYAVRAEWLEPKEDTTISISLKTPEEIISKLPPVIEFTSAKKEAQKAGLLSNVASPASSLMPEKVSDGAEIGTAVHRAVYFIIGAGMDHKNAVANAIFESSCELDKKLVSTQVQLVIESITEKGLLDGSWNVLCEVPFVSVNKEESNNAIVRGVIDILFTKKQAAMIIDIKTDASISVGTQKSYEKQIQFYKEAVRTLLPDIQDIEASLLRTCDFDLKIRKEVNK